MNAFAAADDLRVRLGLASLTEAQADQADGLLADASSLIRSTLHLSISRVENDTVTLLPPVGRELVLPDFPADTPTVVTVGGQGVSDWSFDGRRTLYRPTGWRAYNTTTSALQRVSVTYSHGYGTVPDEFRRICCQAAIRAFTNPSGMLRTETIGDYSYGLDTTTPGVYLTDTEVAALWKAVGLPMVRTVGVI